MYVAALGPDLVAAAGAEAAQGIGTGATALALVPVPGTVPDPSPVLAPGTETGTMIVVGADLTASPQPGITGVEASPRKRRTMERNIHRLTRNRPEMLALSAPEATPVRGGQGPLPRMRIKR